MSEGPVKLPPWLVGILISLLVSMLGTVFYAGQAIQRLEEHERRFGNLETGIHQLWELELRK